MFIVAQNKEFVEFLAASNLLDIPVASLVLHVRRLFFFSLCRELCITYRDKGARPTRQCRHTPIISHNILLFIFLRDIETSNYYIKRMFRLKWNEMEIEQKAFCASHINCDESPWLG